MKFVSGVRGFNSPWLSTVQARLHTKTRLANPLKGVLFDFIPDDAQVLSDILGVFKRFRGELDYTRAYRDGKRVNALDLTMNEEWTSILDACGDNGVMLNICNLHREIPYIGELASMLAGALCSNIRIDAFCSTTNSSATPIHYDYDNAFVAQMIGSKNWRCYDSLSDVQFHFGGYRVEPGTVGDKHFEGVMRKGDGLYIPGGTLHHAFTTNEQSVHLAFDIDPIHPSDAFAELLQNRLRQHNKAGDAYEEYDIDRAASTGVHALSAINNLTANEMLEWHQRYRFWAASRYRRLSTNDIADVRNRTQAWRLSPGAMFRSKLDGENLQIDYQTWVAAMADSRPSTYSPATAVLPAAVLPVLDMILQRPMGFRLCDIDAFLEVESANVLVNALAGMGIIAPRPIQH